MKILKSITACCLSLGLLTTGSIMAQGPVGQTANDYVKPYNEKFQYGANLGWYDNGWTDFTLATLISNAGGYSVRTSLQDYFVEINGYNVRVATFDNYTAKLGFKEIANFVGGPSNPHRDSTFYPGCPAVSKLFKNLYEPIWKADGTVNPNNFYAMYIYKLNQTYGKNIRFWEVINEPDFTGAAAANWLTRAPNPNEMTNVWGPFYNYIRMLRITWEVVKKYAPEDYVMPGGVGYYEFIDALCRYTDNPIKGQEGTVTSNYPLKGGAYFDMVDYHVYPGYYLRYWSNQTAGFVHVRNSDYAAKVMIDHRNPFIASLTKYGYDGIKYPKKQFILTEVNIPRRPAGVQHGSDEMQRNFMIKSLVLAQKNDVRQIYFYMVGEAIDAPANNGAVAANKDFVLMGLYENLKRDKQGSEKIVESGIAMKTTSKLLYNATYDATRTAAMSIPATCEGAAFKKADGSYVYAVWARTIVDKSEVASATYSFPSALGISSVVQYAWNYGKTNATTTRSAANIPLTGAPLFFTSTTAAIPSAPTLTNVTGYTAVRLDATAVTMSWKSTSESLGTRYVVERSADGSNFIALTTINGTGLAIGGAYLYTDKVATASYYYRVYFVDQNGNKVYTKTLYLPLAASGGVTPTPPVTPTPTPTVPTPTTPTPTTPGGVTPTTPAAQPHNIYPNPAQSVIWIGGTKGSLVTAQIFTIDGKLLKTFPKGTTKLLIGELPKGNHILKVTDGAKVYTYKVTFVQ